MPRLNQERQKELEPERMEYAKIKIMALGYSIYDSDDKKLRFNFKGSLITLFPYSGWHSGKGIVAGRGLNKLLKQLK